MESVSELVAKLGFFDIHVLEFARIKYFAAFKAFDKFRIFVSRNNLYARVLAWIHTVALIG
jgi:hypothetical protein